MTSMKSEEEYIKLQKLVSMARLGWWEADFNKMAYLCSPFVVDLLGLKSDTISFKDFQNLICEEYRERILAEFNLFKGLNVYEQIFPIHSKYGITWVSCKVGERIVAEDGSIHVLGMMQCISKQKMNIQDKTIDRLNTLLHQQNSISRPLVDFLQMKDSTEIINQILKDILTQFHGDHAYIFAYNKEQKTQSCTHQMTAPHISDKRNILQKLPLNIDNWWPKQLLSNSPIILFTLDGLNDEDKQELEERNVKSVMALPLCSKDGVCGYIAVDLIHEHRDWNNEDYLWFASLANIVSICMELCESEKKAYQEELYLNSLYEHMPIGYIRLKMIYTDGVFSGYTFLDINKASEQIIGKRFLKKKNTNSPDQQWLDLRNQIPHFLEILNTDKRKDINFRLEDVNKICHSIIYSPAQDEIVMMFSDTTETYLAHQALNKSEKMLRNVYKNLPVGIELYNKDGYLLDLNDKELEIFGLSCREDALGLNIFKNPLVSQEIKAAIKSEKSIDFSFKYNFDHLKEYYQSSRKGTIDIVTKITPLYGSSGELTNYLFINIDNTETTSAYSKIQEFENFFNLIGDFAKVGFAHFNAISHEGYAIKSWFKNIGEEEETPLSQIIGVHSHFHPDDRAMVLAFLDKALKGEANHLRSDIRILRQNGSYTWTRLNVMVRDYRPEEGMIEMVCIDYDITELKETEFKLIEAKNKAEALDRLKSAFLANMSHEIRTPLNAIVGFSELLVNTENIEERQQYIGIVQENNELLLQLISDILDLSKMEAGTFEFVKSDIDLNLLCSEIVCALSMKASAKVKLIFEDHLPECHIWGDKNRLTQVISNFINNALKFTATGSISLGYHLTENEEIRFYVRDTGIGIPSDKISKIFDRFVKLNTFVHGTGLGLSICKSIVEQMDGNIGVESEEGKGSCFWFTHPYIKGMPENTITESLPTKRNETAEEKRAKVLVAEDTDSNYLLVSSILKNEFELKRAHNGKEAIELYESFQPDIILMDVKMPEVDGFEATSEIRKKNKTIPIIAVTAHAFDRDKQKSQEIGCNDYLSKPISANSLKKAIKKWIK